MEHSPMDREEEIDFWKEQFPGLERWEIAEIMNCMDLDEVKDNFWRDNPTLPEDTIDAITLANRDASTHYYLYKKNNNEAS